MANNNNYDPLIDFEQFRHFYYRAQCAFVARLQMRYKELKLTKKSKQKIVFVCNVRIVKIRNKFQNVNKFAITLNRLLLQPI